MSCPCPLKKRFANPRLACEALERIVKRSAPGEKRPCRIYPCEDHWHMTSMPKESVNERL